MPGARGIFPCTKPVSTFPQPALEDTPDHLEHAMNKPTIERSLARDVAQFFSELDLPIERLTEGQQEIRSPITGEVIAKVRFADAQDAKAAIGRAAEAFRQWRLVPA